jgi:hypothetical protein
MLFSPHAFYQRCFDAATSFCFRFVLFFFIIPPNVLLKEYWEKAVNCTNNQSNELDCTHEHEKGQETSRDRCGCGVIFQFLIEMIYNFGRQSLELMEEESRQKEAHCGVFSNSIQVGESKFLLESNSTTEPVQSTLTCM